jgi:hypothetical protein
MALHASPQDVGAHDQHAGGAGLLRGEQALGEDRESIMLECAWCIERQQIGERQVMLTFRQRLQAESRAVELGEGHIGTRNSQEPTSLG